MADPGDGDLSWADRPEEDAEARARRRERRERHRRKRRRQRRLKRMGIVLAVVLVVGLVLGVSWFQWTLGGLERMPSAVGQAGADTPGTTILLVGRNPGEPNAPPTSADRAGQALEASDLVMLLHLPRDNRSMYVISIPHDTVLDIPGHGRGRLTDAYAAGGARLYTRTVEQLTGTRLDRLAVLDLNGFRDITDVLDGVIVDVPAAGCNIPAGPRRFDGQAALEYISLRPCLPRGDLDRVERQQSLLKALMRGAVDSGKVTRPFSLNRMLKGTAEHLTLEKDFSWPSMFGTVWSMRRLRTTNTTFLTVPVATPVPERVRGRSQVRLDPRASAELWAALRADRLADYLATSDDADVLGR